MPQGYLLQMLSAKLGVVTGKNLAQQCRRAWELLVPPIPFVCHLEWRPLMLQKTCFLGNSTKLLRAPRCAMYVFEILISHGY